MRRDGILIAVTWYNLAGMGGVVNVVRNIQKGLIGKGKRIIVLTMGETRFVQKLFDDPPVYSMGFTTNDYPKRSALKRLLVRAILLPLQFLNLLLFMLRHRIGTITIHYYYPHFDLLLLVKRVLRIRLRLVFYGSDVQVEPGKIPVYMKRAQRAIDTADTLIPVSRFLRKRIGELYRVDARKISVVYCSYEPLKPPGDESPHDGPYVLMVSAGLIPVKGPDLAVRAIAEVKNAVPDIKLLIVGDGPEREGLERDIIRFGLERNVEIVGFVDRDRLSSYYANCEFLLLPSRSEGFPLVIQEAFSFAKPVVAAIVGGVPEIVKPGYNGLLFEAENVSEMSERVIELYGDFERIRMMGENGKTILERHFGNRIMIDNFEKVFEGNPPDPYSFIRDEWQGREGS